MTYKNFGGADSCPIVATFLFRTPDFQNSLQIQQFFQVAKAQNILPIIRVASDNSGDNWQAIDTQTAAFDAQVLAQFVKSPTYVIFGNEVNFPNEWGGNSDPVSFTNAFISFATTAQNFKALLPPLSLNGPNPQDYWSKVFETIYNNVGNKNCQTTYSWINKYIAGFAFNVYGPNVASDFNTEINQLKNAGNNLSCNLGFQVENKDLIISELGIPGGVYDPNIAKTIWDYYQALLKTQYGPQIKAATSYVRDANGKVHAFAYITDANGNLTKSAEYNQLVINLGGSTSHGSDSATDPNAKTIPPLGTLVTCPTEIKTSGKITYTQNSTTPTSPNTSATCGLPGAKEPDGCKGPTYVTNKADFCKTDDEIGNHGFEWCNPSSCSNFPSDYCHEANPDKKSGCAKYTVGYCDENTTGDGYWLNRAKVQGGCSNLNVNDKYAISRCINYKGQQSNTNIGEVTGTNILPACIPTSNNGQKCVTECSQPIDMNQYLGNLSPDAKNCLKTGTCRADISIQAQDKMNAFFLPFAQNLSEYFTGVLDAEHQSPADLDALQNLTQEELMKKSGVIKKLLPPDYQDKLKCEFINYIKYRKANKLNTKYVDKDGNEFMVYDKKITDIPCKSDPKYNSSFDKYWLVIPLFQNDESQGKIEFVTPSIDTIDPIYVSIPEVARLASATAVLQQALIPAHVINDRQTAITTDPKNQLPTYGQPIVQSKISCIPTKNWKDLYNNTTILTNEPDKNLTEYTRAVTCEVSSLTGGQDSPICVIGDNGKLNCYKQNSTGQSGQENALKTGSNNLEEKVQVRTTFPYLFEIAEQTIQKSTGFLRIFKPEVAKSIGVADGTKLIEDPFEKAFAPIPASVTNIKYYLPTSSGLAINDKNNKDGWQINFYRLGGLENARNFILKLLNPKQN